MTRVARATEVRSLNPKQYSGLQKVGDCLLPGDPELGLKSFSESKCASQVDRILGYMPEQDLKDLRMLLGIFAWIPRFFLMWIVRLLELSPSIPGPVGGAGLRFMRLGLRGLVMTLYYSDPKTLAVLGYQVSVYMADLHPPGKPRSSESLHPGLRRAR